MSDATCLAVLGAGGRMGRAVIAAGLDDPRFQIAAAHARAGNEAVGEDAGLLAARPACGVIVGDDLDVVVNAADVIIDFTRPEFLLDVVRACTGAKRALVSGTTGMDAQQRAEFENAARKIPVFWAANMSIGVNLLLAAVAEVAARAGGAYDAEIIEAHHRHKVDAPSGTAIAFGEVLAAARGKPLSELAEYGRSGPGQREAGRIGFHSVRAGEIVGEHDVRLVAEGEEIRFGHRAFGRGAFAAGALRAAAWLKGRQPGLHGMNDLLQLPANVSSP